MPLGGGQLSSAKPGVERMCSMLDIQAAWSASLCCGPSGSSRNWPVTSEVGGTKSTGTNASEVMPATVVRWPDLLHPTSSGLHAEDAGLARPLERGTVGRREQVAATRPDPWNPWRRDYQ